MKLPSLRQLLNASTANTVKAAAEKPWDIIFEKATQNRLVPNNAFGRALVFFALTYLGESVAMNTDNNKLFGKIASELTGDMASEFLSRAWKFAKKPGERLAQDPQFVELAKNTITVVEGRRV